MIQSRAQQPDAQPNNYRDLLREATLQLRSLRSELDTIRQQHIQQMEKLKLLRNSDSMILQKEDCLSILKERSS